MDRKLSALIFTILSAQLFLVSVCAQAQEVATTESHEPKALSSPAHIMWNGFLNLINVIELANHGKEPLAIIATLYDLSGNMLGQTTVWVDARTQRDVILNEISGFSENTCGLARLEWSGDTLTGRAFYYQSAEDGINTQFSYEVSIEDALSGDSLVGFNTIYPGINPAESGTVDHWLTIANLDPYEERIFTISRFTANGEPIEDSTTSVRIPALGRVDIEAGHINPGPNSVGSVVISPDTDSSPYIAKLVRYGRVTEPETAFAYNYALPIIARAGATDTQWVHISNRAGADNWVEILNASADPNTLEVTVFDHEGDALLNTDFTLAAYAQTHIAISPLLQPEESGTIRITPRMSASPALLQSTFYYRDSEGSMETAVLVNGTNVIPDLLRGKNKPDRKLGYRLWSKK